MKTTYVHYLSKNGIRYHHTLSAYEEGESDGVLPESHHMCEIFILISGSVEYRIEGKAYTPKPMEILVLAPNELHSLKIDTSQPYERMVVHFAPDLLPSLKELDLLTPLRYAKYSVRIIPKEIVEKFGLYENMNTFKQICLQKGKYLDLRLVGAVIKLIESLNESFETILSLTPSSSSTANKNTVSSTANKNTVISDCLEYINFHLTQPLSAQDLADHLNISVSHIRNSFKKEIGMPLQHYILLQRMQLARTLLSQGQSPQQVANSLGYEYYSTFYQSYMKIFKMKPKSFFKSSNQILFGIENEPL